MGPDEGSLVQDLVHNVKKKDDGEGEVGAEEVLDERLRGHVLVPDGREAGPELRDEHQHVEEKSDPGADDARLRAEGEFVERVALHAPALAEADMCQADGTPGEDGRQTGKCKHPVERFTGLVGSGQVSEKSDDGGEADGDEGTAFAVNVGEDFGSLILFRERRESARGAVDGRVADG